MGFPGIYSIKKFALTLRNIHSDGEYIIDAKTLRILWTRIEWKVKVMGERNDIKATVVVVA